MHRLVDRGKLVDDRRVHGVVQFVKTGHRGEAAAGADVGVGGQAVVATAVDQVCQAVLVQVCGEGGGGGRGRKNIVKLRSKFNVVTVAAFATSCTTIKVNVILFPPPLDAPANTRLIFIQQATY